MFHFIPVTANPCLNWIPALHICMPSALPVRNTECSLKGNPENRGMNLCYAFGVIITHCWDALFPALWQRNVMTLICWCNIYFRYWFCSRSTSSARLTLSEPFFSTVLFIPDAKTQCFCVDWDRMFRWYSHKFLDIPLLCVWVRGHLCGYVSTAHTSLDGWEMKL